MRLAISVLGTEVLAIDTSKRDDDNGPGDVTANSNGFGFLRWDKTDEHEETP